MTSAKETARTIEKLLRQSSPIQTTKKKTKTNKLLPPPSESIQATNHDELRRIFARLILAGDLTRHPNHTTLLSSNSTSTSTSTSTSNSTSTPTKVQIEWNDWLSKRHTRYITQLSDRVKAGKKSAVRTFMGVIASTPHCNGSRIDGALVIQLLQALIGYDADDDVEETVDVPMVAEGLLELLEEEFIQPYRDVQYFMLVEIHRLADRLVNRHSEEQRRMAKTKKDNEDADEMKGGGGGNSAIVVENLLRILLKVEIADHPEDLEPEEVQLEQDGADGTCSNYLFLPRDGRYLGSLSSDMDGLEDEEDEGMDMNEDDNSNTDDDQSSSEDDDDNENTKPSSSSLTTPIPNRTITKKKRKNTLPPQCTISRHKYHLQQSFLSILQYPHIPTRTLKRTLQHLPNHVLPVIANPLRFADFCTRAYDHHSSSTNNNTTDSVLPVLALHSLFLLMTECNLEYPHFYKSLYRLITPSVFYARYRTRFLKLVINCLTKSQMLPAYVVASFCKRLCRCALYCPPSGSLMVLALVSNLLRKHRECACLVHRACITTTGGSTGETTKGTVGNNTDHKGSKMMMVEDKYDAEVDDPSQSHALESSLWELEVLGNHYHPAVASLARECGREGAGELMHDLDLYLVHTYKSLFELERKKGEKKRKKGGVGVSGGGGVVPLTFTEPNGLFEKGDVFDGIFNFSVGDADGGDVVVVSEEEE